MSAGEDQAPEVQEAAGRPYRLSGWNRLRAEVRESLAMAFDSVMAHKLRSGLTLLGILIGVFSIIVVMTVKNVLVLSRRTSHYGNVTTAGKPQLEPK